MNFLFLSIFAASNACTKTFFGIPPWYKYLKAQTSNQCTPVVNHINDIWLIGLALIEILTRVAILASIAFVVYAGIKYSASRGNADKVNSAKNTLVDALTGLIIAIVATAIVSFLGRTFSQ